MSPGTAPTTAATARSGDGGRSVDVVVVGSLNLDLTAAVERHPRPGETVLGGDLARGLGGKGANQAVAAARMDATVAMIGAVGDDEHGLLLQHTLSEEGIDTAGIHTTAGHATGTALIAVTPDGQNTIVVSPGANATLSAEDIRSRAPALGQAAVCALQLEIPLDAVVAAAATADGLVLLDPAPARALPDALYEATDILVPNATELAHLAGVEHEPQDAADAVDLLRLLPIDRAVVTLGAAGAVVYDRGAAELCAPPRVTAVDTTGAGDALTGALAALLAEGRPLRDAAAVAVAAGAAAVTRPGAMPSLPTRAEAERLAAGRSPT